MAAAASANLGASVNMLNESGSAAGATSRTHTLSHSGSNDGAMDFSRTDKTLLLGTGGIDFSADPPPVDLRQILDQMENMQFAQRSPQQPNPELDRLIYQTFATRPEWRQRMAVMSKSSWLRKKLLMTMPPGGRACGSSVLGATHPHRGGMPDEFSDHNWPKVQVNHKGDYHMPGGTLKHHRLLNAPVDKIRVDPLMARSPDHSFPKNQRFPGCHPSGEVNKDMMQKRGTPGPGHYHKSLPRGVAFSADSGETIVFGANHMCPWKSALGHNINPVDVDHTTMTSQPKYSFSKTRRSISEPMSGHGMKYPKYGTMSGHGLQDGGPCKSDLGCLSPGPVYEHFSTFGANTGRALSLKPRRCRSLPSVAKVRCIPVEMPPEEPPDKERTGADHMPEPTNVRTRGGRGY